MVMVLSLIIMTVGVGCATLIGIFRGVNKSKNELYFTEKDREIKERKMKSK